MTFTEFCASYGVTEEEREELVEFLGFMKFRAIMEWLDHMRSK